MKFRIAPEARHDLRGIAEYIAKDNPPRAESYIQELNDKIRAVAKRPMLYPIRDEWKPGLRSAPFRRYHIVFRIDADVVEFLRILHGARDIPGLLDEN
jgi:toxin ParE1/3/4